ncbi:type II toxin-antitoxin system VapC family toxin [Janibacter hoylei]|uniref:type II toxin-antitoxin system VapC family toxin n=1 Tax=Janibacter hoylei TaxID=364298 RepID=UPI00223714B8|nr:type II toxin-antitoxin system VapC family toxin [Janibacter hoylei]MCW4602927.1 type II toxin-antitoxin system VapC family toxin [Janibacter hoylei]
MTRYLLDTNVVVRLLLGDRDSITHEAVDAISDPTNEPLLSAAAVWEIAIKRSLGKLSIHPSWHEALTRLDLVALPVTAEHAARVEDLPWHHRDPFDRLLIAQAMAEEATVVTGDHQIDAYDIATVQA